MQRRGDGKKWEMMRLEKEVDLKVGRRKREREKEAKFRIATDGKNPNQNKCVTFFKSSGMGAAVGGGL